MKFGISDLYQKLVYFRSISVQHTHTHTHFTLKLELESYHNTTQGHTTQKTSTWNFTDFLSKRLFVTNIG